jgi:hypothetical protein
VDEDGVGFVIKSRRLRQARQQALHSAKNLLTPTSNLGYRGQADRRILEPLSQLY